jgi:hypothetical protein
VVTQRLDGRVSRDLKAFKLRKGSLSLTLEVAPGPHTVRLEVSWDDGARSGSIDGLFRAGAGRRLDAELVRFPRVLALNWR